MGPHAWCTMALPHAVQVPFGRELRARPWCIGGRGRGDTVRRARFGGGERDRRMQHLMAGKNHRIFVFMKGRTGTEDEGHRVGSAGRPRQGGGQH